VLIAIYAVPGVGPDETAGFYWVTKPSQANPQRPAIPPENEVTFTITVTNTGPSLLNGACPHSFSSPVIANEGLNTLNASINGGKLFVNGHVIRLLNDPCVSAGASQNAIALGFPVPRSFSQELDSDLAANDLELPRLLITGYDISNTSEGATRANGRFILSKQPQLFLFDEH